MENVKQPHNIRVMGLLDYVKFSFEEQLTVVFLKIFLLKYFQGKFLWFFTFQEGAFVDFTKVAFAKQVSFFVLFIEVF